MVVPDDSHSTNASSDKILAVQYLCSILLAIFSSGATKRSMAKPPNPQLIESPNLAIMHSNPVTLVFSLPFEGQKNVTNPIADDIICMHIMMQ